MDTENMACQNVPQVSVARLGEEKVTAMVVLSEWQASQVELTLLVSNEFTDVDDDEFSDNEVVR
jgi:hypothetical protein